MNLPKIPSGMAMMLKSLGIDVSGVESGLANVAQIMQSVDLRLADIKTQNTEILTRLERLENGGRTEQSDADRKASGTR